MPNLETLIETYGYFAIMLGAFIEGETVLVIGGFLAHRGYLDLPLVIVAAFLGTMAGDQFAFFMGRHHSDFILKWRPSLKPRLDHAKELLDQHRKTVIIGFRFLYGFRNIIPFAIGMSKVSAVEFIVLDLTASLVWSIIIATLGYFFGTAFEAAIVNAKHYELTAMIVIAVVGAVIWAVHFYRRRRKYRLEKSETPSE